MRDVLQKSKRLNLSSKPAPSPDTTNEQEINEFYFTSFSTMNLNICRKIAGVFRRFLWKQIGLSSRAVSKPQWWPDTVPYRGVRLLRRLG
jgi:hypothetical protein